MKISLVAIAVDQALEDRQQIYWASQEALKWKSPKKQGFFSKLMSKFK